MITEKDLEGLNDYVNENFYREDLYGQFYWKDDDECEIPLTIEEVVWFFLNQHIPPF